MFKEEGRHNAHYRSTMKRSTERRLWMGVVCILLAMRILGSLEYALQFGQHQMYFSVKQQQPDPKTSLLRNEKEETAAVESEMSNWDKLLKHLSPIAHSLESPTIRKLQVGLNKTCAGKRRNPCRYQDVDPYIPLKSPVVLPNSIVWGHESKTMIDPRLFFEERSCILYGIGISTDSSFEQSMTPYCEVHAFDCTVLPSSPAVQDKNFSFHQSCIGPKTDLGLKGTSYIKRLSNNTLKFETFMEAMERLKHYRVDYLKFDTEGAEWIIFQTILALPRSRMPRQIMFEIHTEGANPDVVPVAAVQGKNRGEVNQIMLDLIEAGYGILDVVINPLDKTCAEISMLLLNDV